MPRMCRIVLFALALLSTPALAAQRVTHTDGVVFVDRDGVHAQAGRAELILPDGAIVHVDVDSDVQVDRTGHLVIRRGRVAIRTMPIAPWTRATMPTASAGLAPGGAYSVVFDPIRQHLLVSVRAGRAEIESARGGVVLGAGERAVMYDGSGAPAAMPFTSTADRFSQWSESRLQQASAATIAGPRDPHPGFAEPSSPGWYGDTGMAPAGAGISTLPVYGYGYGYGYGGKAHRGKHSRDPYAPDFTPRSPRRREHPLSRFGPRGLDAPVLPPPRHRLPRPERPPLVTPPPGPPPPSPKVNGTSGGVRVPRPAGTRPPSM